MASTESVERVALNTDQPQGCGFESRLRLNPDGYNHFFFVWMCCSFFFFCSFVLYHCALYIAKFLFRVLYNQHWQPRSTSPSAFPKEDSVFPPFFFGKSFGRLLQFDRAACYEVPKASTSHIWSTVADKKHLLPPFPSYILHPYHQTF